MNGTATVAELALATVECPRCGAKRGVSCPSAMGQKAEAAGDQKAVRELRQLAHGAPLLMHPERLQKAEELVDSAVAYGLVQRIPAGEKTR